MMLLRPSNIICSALYTVYVFVLADISDDDNQYTVELLILVDKSAYLKWFSKITGSTHSERMEYTIRAIQRHYSSAVHDVNSMYRGAKPHGLSLQVKPVEIRVMTSEAILTTTDEDDVIQTPTALNNFYAWTESTEMTLPRYDHAMLITGLDMEHAGRRSLAGGAYLAQICTGWSISVLENAFGHSIVALMAHELGHRYAIIASTSQELGLGFLTTSLGVRQHDGHENTCDAENYVMASTYSVDATHRWDLSSCSIDAIKSHFHNLTREGRQCLLDNPVSEDTPAGKPLGELYTPDDQCALIRESDSFFCRDFYIGDGAYHKMCQTMWCRAAIAKGNSCYSYMGSDGFVCGNKKVCYKGKCLVKVDAPSPPDNCPQGDQPGIVKKNFTCSQVTSLEPLWCYYSPLKHRCCQSCMSIAGEPGCEYGDKSPSCWTDFVPERDCPLNLDLCCGTCTGVESDSDSISSKAPTIDSVTTNTQATSESPPTTAVSSDTSEGPTSRDTTTSRVLAASEPPPATALSSDTSDTSEGPSYRDTTSSWAVTTSRSQSTIRVLAASEPPPTTALSSDTSEGPTYRSPSTNPHWSVIMSRTVSPTSDPELVWGMTIMISIFLMLI